MSIDNEYNFVKDVSMRNLIKSLNEAGLETIFCCSGISNDHLAEDKVLWYSSGSVTFKTNFSPYDKRNEIIYYMAKCFNLDYKRVYNIRENEKICLTELSVKSILNSYRFKAKYDAELEVNYIDDPNFRIYADIVDMLSKNKWELMSKAVEIIKEKGLKNTTSKDISSLINKNDISASMYAVYLKNNFKSEMRKHYKKKHILEIIDGDNPIRTYNVKLKKAKKKIEGPMLVSETAYQNDIIKIGDKILFRKNKKENEKILSTLVFEV